MELLAGRKDLAAEFQVILDQPPAPKGNPDPLWDQAKACTAGLFAQQASGTTPAPLKAA
jgi:hypothetical protein